MSKEKNKRRRSYERLSAEQGIGQIFDKDPITETVYFNNNGAICDTKNACAVRIKVNTNVIFKVPVSRKGKLYNPLLEGPSYGLNKRDRITQDQMFKFKETNQVAFEAYLGFLKTKYDSFLVKAERDL